MWSYAHACLAACPPWSSFWMWNCPALHWCGSVIFCGRVFYPHRLGQILFDISSHYHFAYARGRNLSPHHINANPSNPARRPNKHKTSRNNEVLHVRYGWRLSGCRDAWTPLRVECVVECHAGRVAPLSSGECYCIHSVHCSGVYLQTRRFHCRTFSKLTRLYNFRKTFTNY